MFNISDYLQKFRTITHSHEGQVKDVVCEVVCETVGADVSRDAVTYTGKQVFIKAHPLIKNEVIMKKKDVLAKVQARSSCVVNDIK